MSSNKEDLIFSEFVYRFKCKKCGAEQPIVSVVWHCPKCHTDNEYSPQELREANCQDKVFDQKGNAVCIANLGFPTYCRLENCPRIHR